MKKPKYSIAKFLYILGGGVLLFVVGLTILFWIAFEILFPAPKICVSDILNLKSTHSTPHISESLELIGHFGGSVQSVFTTNSYAYAGIGSEIAVLDITNPSRPQRVGYHVLPDTVRDIYVDGNYAYVAIGEWGFKIIDISNPTTPLEVGSYATVVPINKVIISKGYAYLPLSACNYGGTFSPTRCSGAIQIIDVTNPSNPTQIECHKMSGTPASIAIDGDFAYISEFVSSGVSDARLLKMDISKPKFARVIKVHNLDFGGNITVNNDYLYFSARYDKFRILNISNPNIYFETGLYDSRNPSGTRNAIFDAVIFENYAYLVVEDVGIQVLDISNPGQPVLVSTYAMDDEIKDISLGEGYVFIATENNGIQIIDVTNPSIPIQAGAYESPNSVTKLEVTNNLIYAAAEDNGLRIIDASNPKMPLEVGLYLLPEEVRKLTEDNDPAYITGVAIEDNQAYLAVKDIGVQVVDISNPSTPIGSSFYPLANGINDIAVRDNFAYISTGNNGVEIMSILPDSLADVSSYNMPYSFVDVAVGDKYAYILGSRGLLTVDLSDPSIFTQVGFHNLNANSLSGLAVDSEYIYIASSSGLQVVSLLDTGIPVKENYSELKGINLEDLVLDGNYMYAAASNGLKVLDVSNPLKPALKGSCDTENWTDDLAKAGDFVYLVVRDEGIWIIDVSNPSNPMKVGRYTPPRSARGVATAGNYAYIAAGGDGLRIVDVTNPAAPIETGFLENIGFAEDVAIAGNYAYVSLRDSLVIADITNPYKPTKVKEYDLAHSPWRQRITLAGHYAYLPSHDDGLWVVNIATPNETNNSYHYTNIYETTGIDDQGDYLYVAAEGDGLRIVNISETMTATEVGIYQEAGINAHDVAVFENHAYIANLRSYPSTSTKNDLVIIDISDPSNPVRTGSYELPWDARGVDVDGKYIYVATGTDGIFIFQIK